MLELMWKLRQPIRTKEQRQCSGKKLQPSDLASVNTHRVMSPKMEPAEMARHVGSDCIQRASEKR